MEHFLQIFHDPMVRLSFCSGRAREALFLVLFCFQANWKRAFICGLLLSKLGLTSLCSWLMKDDADSRALFRFAFDETFRPMLLS